MKRAFVLSEQGVVNIYFIRDEHPRIQWLIDLGIPNFSVFMLELPIPLENPAHTEIVFHEGTALLLEQIKVFLEQNEFGQDGGLFDNIIKAIKETEINMHSQEPLTGYEILFPLGVSFYQKVLDRLVKQRTASRETDASMAVWKAPMSNNTRYVPNEGKVLKQKDQTALRDAQRLIDQYKGSIYKHSPGPLYVILYDQNGRQTGVSRVTQTGLTKWACEQTVFANEEAEVPTDVLEALPETTSPSRDYQDGQDWMTYGLYDPEQRVAQLEEKLGRKLKKIGSGSSRVVYELTPDTCLKLALNDAGIAQNKQEYTVFSKVQQCTLITRIFYYDPKFEWLICEKAHTKVSPDSFDIYGFDCLRRLVFYSGEDQSDDMCNEYSRELSHLVHQLHLEPADIENTWNWGLVNRHGKDYPVLVDYGLSPDVYQRFYASTTKVAEEDVAVPPQLVEALGQLDEFDADHLAEALGHRVNQIGSGSSRNVYAISPTICLKVAKNDLGLKQNEAEVQAHEKAKDCTIITRIFYFDLGYQWILCERVYHSATQADLQEIYGGDSTQIVAWAEAGLTSQPFYQYDPKAFRSLRALIKSGCDALDLYSLKNWGIVKRRGELYPVILDYGLTPAIFSEYTHM